MNKQEIHAANQRRWDAGAGNWQAGVDRRGLWKRCPSEPELVLSPLELSWLGELSERRACVLGSGDNQVAFALAGLGAKVTSVDISQNQLDFAQARARVLGLEMSFLRADVTELSALRTGSFDVVYTGGHVAVWVADLERYYAEAVRILRPEGLFMVNEYHPFRRVWQASTCALRVEAGYFERGPFAYDLDDDVLRPKHGDLRAYEFHWTVADYLNAVVNAGARLLRVDEFGSGWEDWEVAPMQGLPEFLLLIARKGAA